MKSILIVFSMLLLSGCARNACQIAVDNMTPAPKIPHKVTIEIDKTVVADDGGQEFLKNYVKLSTQVNSLVESCKLER
jgi:hypothetical protein